MFASTDAPGSRNFRVYLHTNDGLVPARIPDHLLRQAGKSRHLSNANTFMTLAKKLASQTWMRYVPDPQGVKGPALSKEAATYIYGSSTSQYLGEPVAVNAITLRLWKTRFDVSTLTLRTDVSSSVTIRTSGAHE